MISPGRLLLFLRRDIKRGWAASYHDYKTKPRITEWKWPYWNETPMPVPVHVLTGANDWHLCAWMLASWFTFTEQTWRVVIHDDGTLPPTAKKTLSTLFKTARFISRSDADPAMDKLLRPFPFCHEYRTKHPLSQKIFDIPHFCDSERFIILDSDILFYRYPSEIMQWVTSDSKECWFNEDCAEANLISTKDAWDDLGVKLWPRVNSGLCLLQKNAIDLEFCERALGETSILKGHIWRIEQTLIALCGSRTCRGGLLPKTYEVTLAKNASSDTIARHYVGAVRDRFYAEGLAKLAPVLLTKEEN
jgi:hypothetical protein